jgi:hypothetical protein
MGDCAEHAIAFGTQPHTLDGAAAMGGEMEHLLAGQHRLDRTTELARGERAQDHVGVDRQLAAETAADVAADDTHVCLRDHQRVRDPFARAFDELGRAVNHHPVSLPPRQARMRFHLRVDVKWGAVGFIDAHRGGCEGRLEIADRAVGFGPVRGLRLESAVEVILQRMGTGLGVVVDPHQARSGARLLDGFSDNERHRVAVLAHLRIGKARKGSGEPVVALVRECRLRGRIAVGQHQQHTGRTLGARGVDSDDPAAGDGSLDDEAASRTLAVAHFVGIRRGTCYLEATINAVGGTPVLAVPILVERIRRRGLVHLHEGFLMSSRLRTARRSVRAASAGS